MKSDIVHVSSKGDGFDEALRQTEATAVYRSLPKKDAIHLRLLTEEMMGLLKALTGEHRAEFRIESEGNAFRLHLTTQAEMNGEMRKGLLSVSSSGENASATGILGKLRDLYERMIEPADGTIPPIYLSGWISGDNLPVSASETILQTSALNAHSTWSMRRCIGNGPNEDWDGLEKSIIANIADDVEIGIIGNTVEMTVLKTF